jgi:hypothetical protein
VSDPGDDHDPVNDHDPVDDHDSADDHDPVDADDGRPAPVTVDADATRLGRVVLVTCRLHNRTTAPRAVTLRDELPGPTLPPRRNGVPERGWNDDTYTTVLPPAATQAVGYASPRDGSLSEDPLPEPPATVVAVDDPATTDTGDRVSHARRELPGWAPPDDVVQERVVADGGTTADDETAVDGRTTTGDEATADGETTPDGEATAGDETVADGRTTVDGEATVDSETVAAAGVPPEPDTAHPATGSFADGTVPTVVAAYLDAAAERIERAEGTAEGVQAATDALRDTHHTPVTLEQAVARDEAALRALAERAATLADRAAAADVPVDSLRRLS